MINLVGMLTNSITELFTRMVGTWQGPVGVDGKPTKGKALLVLFTTKRKRIEMLIHAPGNYVGVYTRKENGKWKCLCYHDSCWRREGVDRFLYEHCKDIQFSFISFPSLQIYTVDTQLTDSIFVVKLSEETRSELTQVRNKK